MMLLYHGSNVKVSEPKIIESRRSLDFGSGLYLTSDYEQAKKWAELKHRRLEEGSPIISVFECDEKELNRLSVLLF